MKKKIMKTLKHETPCQESRDTNESDIIRLEHEK